MITQKLVTFPLRLGLSATRMSLRLTGRALGAVVNRGRHGDAPVRPPQARPPRPRSGSDEQPPAGSQAPNRSDQPSSRTTQRSENGRATDPRSAGAGLQDAPAAPPPPPEPAVQQTPPESAPDELPETPLSPTIAAAAPPPEPDELVGEYAEPGAEDGAGAQIQIEPPWEGYDAMAAQAVVTRLQQASPEELAVVELYERMHKARRTVLAAAERRLRELNPPGA
jgi:hypothetical protein